jgi:gliding motility-associated-like protein
MRLLILTILTPLICFGQNYRSSPQVIKKSQSTQIFIGGIINDYTPVISLDICDNKILVENGSAFNAGDTVLIIQMKGADMDTTNSSSYGSISAVSNAGNYEINYVKSKSGNTLALKNNLTKNYNFLSGKVQLVRVPFFSNVTITSPLTCLTWDGSKGGVLVLNVSDTVTLQSIIDVTGKGFVGGIDPVSNPPVYDCYEAGFYYPPNPDVASGKGECISFVSNEKSFGRGSPANGGGGGNSHNSGGGGGSNTGSGGFGGYEFEGDPCTNTPFDNRGFGGKALPYANGLNKIFLGGGGGAGQSNNAEGFQALGGAGGGIVIIMANRIMSNGMKIIANGADAVGCGSTGPLCHEGMGGGGGAGAILIQANNYLDNITIETKGGKGGDMTASGFLRVGPGGGGGGGSLWLSNSSQPASVNHNKSGGLNGVTIGYSNDPFGATKGNDGSTLLNLQIPIDNILFKKNIDSVRIKDSMFSCNSFAFNGFGYFNTNPISSWFWDFGDGNTSSSQNLNHSYLIAGTYTVKLVITDINGCKDSINRIVIPLFVSVDAGANDTICVTGSTTLSGTVNGTGTFAWSPSQYLSNPNVLNPVATPPLTQVYYLTATNGPGCLKVDSTRIDVRSFGGFSINQPDSICFGNSTALLAGGGDIYLWSPASSLSNPNISNPNANPLSTTPYSVHIIDTLCGFSTDLNTFVNVLSLPAVKATKSNDIDCTQPQSHLVATGANTYSWNPGSTLNNSNIASPIATPTTSTIYVVKGTDRFGCYNSDSTYVKVTNENKTGYALATAFTPNNDGLNDCYGLKYWGTITELQFSIFNRWGQRIFYTNNPSICWDGTYLGVQQATGVFVYMVKANTKCQGIVFRKGTFALIR